MKLYLIAALLILAIPVYAEESRDIETNNSFGGKTIEITGFGGKESAMSDRWDQYLVEQEGNLIIYGSTRLKRKLTRLVNYYNAGGTVMKDAIEYDPECEYSRTLHIVSETNTYPAREKDKGYAALIKEVLFDKSTTRETGMVSAVYTYVQYHFRNDDVPKEPDPEVRKEFGFEVSQQEQWTFGNGIRYIRITYSDEWKKKNGYDKGVIFTQDGVRAHKDYIYPDTGTNALKLKRNYYILEWGKNNYIYRYSGTEIRTSGNEFGGITVDCRYEPNDYFRSSRGIEHQVLKYDSNNVLRYGLLEGAKLIVNDSGYGVPLGRHSFLKIVDLFDAKGDPISEEMLLDESANSLNATRIRQTYGDDRTLTVEVSYPEKYLASNDARERPYFLKYDPAGNVCARSLYWSLGATDYDEQRFFYGSTPRVAIDVSSIPVPGIADYQKEYPSIMKREYYKKGKMIRVEQDKTSIVYSPLGSLKLRSLTVPAVIRLSERMLADYISRWARNDYEKAYMLFMWETNNIAYDNHFEISAPIVITLKGVCMVHVSLFNSIAKKLGLTVRSAGGYTGGRDVHGDHAWIIIKIGSRYFPIDPTWKKFITDPEKFLVDHWPSNPELQLISPPYDTYESYKKSKGIGTGALDNDLRLYNVHLDINNWDVQTYKWVEVEYKGKYYPAVIKRQKGVKYFIHYNNFNSSWDEWITKDRIKNWTVLDCF